MLISTGVAFISDKLINELIRPPAIKTAYSTVLFEDNIVVTNNNNNNNRIIIIII